MNGATNLGNILGPLAETFADPSVIEISCNPSGDVYVEAFGAAPRHWGQLDVSRVEQFIRWCATLSATGITADRPIFSGRVPETSNRIEALMPPVVERPCFSIRRHTEQVLSLAEFVSEPVPRAVLAEALRSKRNILIAGATGAGKTTLLNACLHEMAAFAPATRLVTIEDTPEIRTPLPNNVSLVTSDTIGMDRLLVSALRQAPDRIVVGEVREGRVLMTLIKAWNTGHPGGIVTLHANSAEEVMPRLQLLAAEVLTTDPVPILLQAMDMVVFLRRGQDRPEIKTIQTAHRTVGHPPQMEICYEQP